jgi:hypothetical protein
MISRLLLTACLMSIFYSQTSLASVIIDDANIDKGESFNRVPTEVIKAHFIPYVPKTALLLNRAIVFAVNIKNDIYQFLYSFFPRDFVTYHCV